MRHTAYLGHWVASNIQFDLSRDVFMGMFISSDVYTSLHVDQEIHHRPTESVVRDTWTVHGNLLTRHHRVPRLAAFRPSEADSLPVPQNRIHTQRTTYALIEGQERIIQDEWNSPEHRNIGKSHWYGRTVFRLQE